MNNPTRRSRLQSITAPLTLALVLSLGMPAHAHDADQSASGREQHAEATQSAAQTPGHDALNAYATISIERVDDHKNSAEVYAGDILEWDITYTNKTADTTLTILPTSATIENTAIVGNRGYCRWKSLAPGSTAHCRGNSNAIYRVTPSHVGTTVTPEVTFTVMKGSEVIAENYTIQGTPFTVREGERPTAKEAPTPLVDGEAIELARHHKDGFACYRIPALTTAPNGDLLAAWDGRPHNCADAPNPNSIVQRVSKDGGQTWSAPITIASGHRGAQKYGYSDPSYVVDRETNTIFMFFVKSYDASFVGSAAGTDDNQRNVLHAAVMESTDNGATWGPIKTITTAITPNPNTMRARFAASGEGIQLRHPRHKGRLIQQFTYAITQAQGSEEWKAVSVYSDDHGATWKAGVPVGAGMDENKVVELSDGTVMLNSRSSGSGAVNVKARRVTYSHDGGHSYGDVKVRADLVDQNNNAGLTRAFPDVPAEDWRSKVLIFTNTANAGARNNGTAKVSYDDGKSWATAKQFYAPHTGYTTITPLKAEDGTLNSGRYGILFEKDGSGISYMQITDQWLDLYRAFPGGEDRAVKRGGNIVTFTVENRGTEPLSGATLSAQLPRGWKLTTNTSTPLAQAATRAQEGSVTLPLPSTLAVGETARLAAKVIIPADAQSQAVTIPLNLVDAGRQTAGAVTLTVEGPQVNTGTSEVCQAGVRIVNTPPSETVNEPGHFNRMLDANPTTFWHTPWSGGHVPTTVDFTVTRTAALKDLVLTNRADAKNGRLVNAELGLVTNGAVTPLETISNAGLSATVSLAKLAQHVALGQKATLRLRITSTDGNTPSQRNRFASLAELCAREAHGPTAPHDELPAQPLSPATPATPPAPSATNNGGNANSSVSSIASAIWSGFGWLVNKLRGNP